MWAAPQLEELTKWIPKMVTAYKKLQEYNIAKECGDEMHVDLEKLAQMIDDVEGRYEDVEKVASTVVVAPGSKTRSRS